MSDSPAADSGQPFQLFNVEDGATDLLSQFKRTANNPNAWLATGLAGLGAGGLGAYLSSRIPSRRNETPEKRRRRILRDALMSGGMGAGGVAMGFLGHTAARNAVADDKTKKPWYSLYNVPASARIGGASAAGLLTAGAQVRGRRERYLKEIANIMKTTPDKLTGVNANLYVGRIATALRSQHSPINWNKVSQNKVSRLFAPFFTGATSPEMEARQMLHRAGLEKSRNLHTSYGRGRLTSPRHFKGRYGILMAALGGLLAPELVGKPIEAGVTGYRALNLGEK